MPKKTIDIYDKLERGSTNNLEIKGIEELTKAVLAGDIPDQRVAWGEAKKLLETRVERSSSGVGFNQELLLAMTKPSWGKVYDAYSALPHGQVEVVKKEARPVGKAMAEINRRAEEMLQKDLVDTFEKGVVRITENHPELEEQDQAETYG